MIKSLNLPTIAIIVLGILVLGLSVADGGHHGSHHGEHSSMNMSQHSH